MIKKIVTLGLLASTFGALAQSQSQSTNAPSNSYFDVGYAILDSSNSPDIWNIDVNHGFTDHLSWGAEVFNVNGQGFDLTHFELNFGYKTGISERTDFFSKIHLGHEDWKYFDTFVYGLSVGTRTAFSKKFELHSEVKYNYMKRVEDSYYKAEIKGVYNFNDQSGLGLAIQSWDGDETGYELSYRYSF